MEAGFGYYEKVRSGRKRPSPERLMDLMRVLGFTPHHVRVCYLELFGAEPILPAEPPSAHWDAVIAGQQEMACVVTPDGRLRAWNEPFAELFAKAGVPTNWWSWALSGHQAGEILLEWDTQWVPPLMEELRLLHLRHPDELALRDLYVRALADRHLRQVAEAHSGLDDLARPMRHPKRGPGTARIMAARTNAETIMTVLFEAA
ncbi:sulfotransferase [Streptomyces canus]|uniref:sulfotransferase n=1 Tax=Streptomyces canus TaxID=58343 RepID=UPI0033E32267